jgi:hypothetical protein
MINMIEIPQRHDTTEIVLKVALNTITLTYRGVVEFQSYCKSRVG